MGSFKTFLRWNCACRILKRWSLPAQSSGFSSLPELLHSLSQNRIVFRIFLIMPFLSYRKSLHRSSTSSSQWWCNTTPPWACHCPGSYRSYDPPPLGILQTRVLLLSTSDMASLLFLCSSCSSPRHKFFSQFRPRWYSCNQIFGLQYFAWVLFQLSCRPYTCHVQKIVILIQSLFKHFLSRHIMTIVTILDRHGYFLLFTNNTGMLAGICFHKS